MAFTLRMTFHGVALFTELDNSMAIFFCKIDENIARHNKSFVRFDAANYKKKNNKRKIDGWAAPKQARNGYRRHRLEDSRQHILLNGERISIEATTTQTTLEINRKQDSISKTPTVVDNESVIWLPSLNNLAPGSGDLNRAYFNSPLRTEPPLRARFDLTKGYLRTNGTERVQVPFKRPSEDKDQAEMRPIARELVLELKVEDDHFFLRSDPLEGDTTHPATSDMRFDANGSDTVALFIGNDAESEIYKRTPPIVPIDVIDRTAAQEYTFYFSQCSKQEPFDPLLPHVAARPASDPVLCSPAKANKPSGI